MHTIVFIAPHAAVNVTAHAVIAKLGLEKEIKVITAGLDTCLDVAREAVQDGVHVVIARGWTADLISDSDIEIPVVDIPLGIHDLAESLRLARAQTGLENPRIALIIFSRMHWDLTAFTELLGMNLHIYLSESKTEAMHQTVQKAADDKTDMIIGGISSTLAAAKLGIPSALLSSGTESVRQAILQACKVTYARKLEQIQAQKLHTVLDNSRDGIISVDSEGYVLLINSVALSLLQLKHDPTHAPIDNILPITRIQECLREGKPIHDEVFSHNKTELLLSFLPIQVKNEITGAIITFQKKQSVSALEKKLRVSTSGLVALYSFKHIIGKSKIMQQTLQKARHYASGAQSILIVGETGTGKELFAHAIHNASPFKDGPFVAVNCGSLPPSLLESELFGYEAGAFTGATHKGKAGFFELAHEGTLFLDEISELDLQGQTRLLRILEERSLMRLGGTRRIYVNLRILAATNNDLRIKVQQGTFRQDLYYRLKVLSLVLPPLRTRGDDCLLLSEHFLQEQNKSPKPTLDAESQKILQTYSWPGNVRELRYAMDSVSMDCNNGIITGPLMKNTLDPLENIMEMDANLAPMGQNTLAKTEMPHEKARIVAALEHCQWHQGNAAKYLDINRTTLYRQMKKYNVRAKP